MNTDSPTPLDALGIVIESEATPAKATPRPRAQRPGTLIMQPPAKSSLLGRIGMGLLCSVTVTAMMHLLYLKKAIAYACAITLWLLGWTAHPPDGEARPALTERVVTAAKKAAGRFKPELAEGDEAPTHRLLPKLLSPTRLIAAPVNKAMGDVVDKGKKVADTVKHEAHEAGETVKTKADAIAAALRDQREANARTQAEADKAEKITLLKRAAALKLECDEGWPVAALRQAVADAERDGYEAAWRKRYNGSCPHCTQPMKVPTRGTAIYRCPRCGNDFLAASIRATKPPMPRNFRGFR